MRNGILSILVWSLLLRCLVGISRSGNTRDDTTHCPIIRLVLSGQIIQRSELVQKDRLLQHWRYHKENWSTRTDRGWAGRKNILGILPSVYGMDLKKNAWVDCQRYSEMRSLRWNQWDKNMFRARTIMGERNTLRR